MRILIVDDDPIALEILKFTLEEAGHDVACATDGRLALTLFSDDPRDVVISDWQMPHLDGLGLCQAIRRGGFPSYTYIILLTGHNTTEERVRGLVAGADD